MILLSVPLHLSIIPLDCGKYGIVFEILIFLFLKIVSNSSRNSEPLSWFINLIGWGPKYQLVSISFKNSSNLEAVSNDVFLFNG